MSSGLFSRIKNWANGEVLTNEDLNAEFNNLITNAEPDQIGGHSDNATEMRQTTSPGAVGSESLATNLAGELERLRFMVKALSGETQWYTSPSNTLASLSASVGGGLPANRIISGRQRSGSSQLIALTPAGSGNGRTVTLKGASTNFVYAVENTQYTISTDVTSAAITAAPSTNNTCLVNEAFADDSEETKYLGEFGTSLTVDNMGSEITALVGKLAGFKINNGSADEYFIARVKSTTELTEIRRGYGFDSSDAPIPRVAIANNDTITLMTLSWVFADTGGALDITNAEPVIQSDTPSSPAIGQYWFDITNAKWKTYNGASFDDADSTLIGVAWTDDTDTVAARTFDQFKSVEDKNTIEIEIFDNTQVRATGPNQECNVFGTEIKFQSDRAKWDMDSDLDTGITEAARTVYYLYMTETGDTVISDIAPASREADYQGIYHPHQTWRCVGICYNDSSSNITNVLSVSDKRDANIEIVSEVNSSALTVRVLRDPSNPYIFANSTTQAKGVILPGTALTITSGSTLGTDDADDAILRFIGCLNNGRLELAVGTGGNVQPGDIVSTTAEGGAGGADTAGTLYSKVALSNVPAMPLGKAVSNQTTAGTWAATLDELKLWPFLNMGKVAVQSFTSSGTYVPARGLRQAIVISKGGGGGGGGADTIAGSTDHSSAGGGGGSGGLCIEIFNAADLGATETVTIGAGGSAGAATGGSGGTGGNTTFGSHHTASGGGGGGGAISAADLGAIGIGGAGGAAADATLNFTGTAGNCGNAMTEGTVASAGGGSGGAGLFGGAGRGGAVSGGAASSAGSAGVNGGGGGGGANIATVAGTTGGAGGAGYCVVIELLEE